MSLPEKHKSKCWKALYWKARCGMSMFYASDGNPCNALSWATNSESGKATALNILHNSVTASTTKRLPPDHPQTNPGPSPDHPWTAPEQRQSRARAAPERTAPEERQNRARAAPQECHINTRAALEKRQRCNRAAPEECESSARAVQEQHRSSAR